jgi:N utilization substance protein B
MTVKISRREQRQFAFQVLYALHFEKAPTLEFIRRTFDNFQEEAGETPPQTDLPFARSLVQGVYDTNKELDTTIARFSKHWKLNRIAKIELTILRLAVFEILHVPDVPVRVTINEAIELAKKFGDDNSRTFVNGILDAVAKDVAKVSNTQ